MHEIHFESFTRYFEVSNVKKNSDANKDFDTRKKSLANFSVILNLECKNF